MTVQATQHDITWFFHEHIIVYIAAQHDMPLGWRTGTIRPGTR